jgi:hypothetical protein
MDTKFGDLKRKILLLLADEADEESPVGGGTYSAALLQDAVHAALNAICQRVWKSSVAVTEEDVSTFGLPSDVIDVEAVYDTKLGIFIPRIQMQVGQAFGHPNGNAWHLFPSGTLAFINNVIDGATVYYSARWAKPTRDNDLLEPPDSALTCLILYSASYCVLTDIASSGSIRQFNTKVDSGVPTDIPAKVVSDFLLARFEIELKRVPMGEKVRTQ